VKGVPGEPRVGHHAAMSTATARSGVPGRTGPSAAGARPGPAAWSRPVGLWSLALAAAAAATLAAVVAWQTGLGQRHARIGDALVVAACCLVGAIVLTSRPGQPVGRVLLVGGAAWGLAALPVELLVLRLQDDPSDAVAAAGMLLAFTVRGLGWLALVVVLPLVFPDGASGARRRWLAVAAGTLGLFAAVMVTQPRLIDDRVDDVDNPVGLPAALGPVSDVGALVVLGVGTLCVVVGLVGVARQWRRGDELRRQQVGWFGLGLLVALGGAAALASGLVGAPVYAVAAAALPVAVGVAVLQHRLYEVDVLVNRTLLYVSLTAAVAAVYVLVVAGVGAALGARGEGWLPWVATAVVAVAVQPLREVLQGGVNRLTFGAWQEPQALLRSVHDRLEQAATPDGALREVLAGVRASLRLDGLAVADTESRPVAADGGAPGTDARRFPLVHAGRPVGSLAVAGGRRRRRDDATLTELAAALAPAVRAARLHADLQRSRERLVVAREEERRMLRRDLHDGLGSALAGLGFKIDAARNRLGDDPLLRELRGDVQAAVADVRRLVEGLRPVSLDELGLPGALERLVTRASPGGPRLTLVSEGAESPTAAVEVAAYRIVQEALTNVLRHSGARACDVEVRRLDGSLVVTVADDGTGAADAGIPVEGGAGLPGMRERAEELGGTFAVLPRAGGGTVVRAVLPQEPT
jgi:signal transduction histidine kinase